MARGEITFTSQAVMERDEFGRFIAKVRSGGADLMEAVATDFEGRARRYAPIRSGRLRRSIQALVLNGYREVRVVSDVPYAKYMEEGTRPHLIRGVRANFRYDNNSRYFKWNNYRFGPYGSGKEYENWSYAAGATVRHPGTRGHFFFKRAYRETMAEVPARMKAAYRA